MRANTYWPTIAAEVRKQHQSRTRGKLVFFSMLLWPALAFLTSYFMMKPYKNGAGSVLSRVIPNGGVPLFLLSGYLVFQLFWSVVQAAWLFEQERKDGTLEIVFLSPASKMAFLYGRSLYSLLHGIWMFAVFSLLAFLFIIEPKEVNWPALFLALSIILVSAIVWGAMLCALALFSRDSGLLYYLFQAPMELFGGVRIPPAVFPVWASALSLLFPVTYSLVLVRGALTGVIGVHWWTALAVLTVGSIALIACTRLILTHAERHVRSMGSWTLF